MKESIQLISPLALVAAALLVFSTVENSRAATSPTAAEAPVEFIYGGITPNHEIAYKIKVNTDKPIEEVHMSLKETDANGKVLFDGDLIWQNIQHSKQQPIEQGKTYEATMMMSPGAVKAECSLKEVFFKDHTQKFSPNYSYTRASHQASANQHVSASHRVSRSQSSRSACSYPG